MRGPDAESLAARFLVARGLRILARNFRTRSGEIDIVALEGATVCIVEVRARAVGALVSALESVDFTKRRRVERTALAYARAKRLGDRPMRFDVVAVTGEKVEWVRGAW